MQLKPDITYRDVVYLLIVVGGIFASYYSLKQDSAIAGEIAQRAEKLSAKNTDQISDLKDIVHDLAKSIAVQNETITKTRDIQRLESENFKDRLKDFKERIDRERP